MNAAITAGGQADEALARALGVPVKALATFGGATMLDRSIDAVRGAGARRIVVIGGDAVRRACADRVDEVLPESPSGSANVRRAIGEAAGEALLLASSDLPFVTAAATRAFVDAARAADVALPLAGGDAYELAYPGAPPHLTRLGRERVANGSFVYFAPGVAPRALDVAERLFDARKSLVRMAALLGPALLARYASGRLRIEHVEARGSALLGVRVRAVRGAAPELCFDVDTVRDVAYARAHAARG